MANYVNYTERHQITMAASKQLFNNDDKLIEAKV